MCTKAEWKACAERRLVENLALRTLIAEMDRKITHYYEVDYRVKAPGSLLGELRDLVRTAKEIGK